MFKSILKRGGLLTALIGLPLTSCTDTSVIIEPTLEGLAAACGQASYTVNQTDEILRSGAPAADPVNHQALCTGTSACSLRAAVYTAAVCRDSGPKTINLPAGARIDVAFDHGTEPLLRRLDRLEEPSTGPVRLPRIYGDITIEGNGATLAFRRNPAAVGADFARLFHVTRFGSLELRNLSVEGFATPGAVSSAPRGNDGKAVLNDGVLRTQAVTFQGNQNAIGNHGFARVRTTQFEGNFTAFRNHGTASLDQTVFTGNRSNTSGLAILNAAAFVNMRGSNARVVNSTIRDSLAGAAIANGGELDLVGNAVTGNDRSGTGNVIVNSGSLLLATSTVSGNGSIEGADTIRCDPLLDPAAPASATAALVLQDVTMVQNDAVAGIRAVQQCSMTFDNSVVSNDSGVDCAQIFTVSTANRSADTDGTCRTGFSISTPLQMGLLSRNGVLTANHIPQAGSPLIDAGTGCRILDQRFRARPAGSACDIGAVERRP